MTSVCTGSIILGAAGLLDGYRATSHWAARPQLALFGARPVDERVVIDRNRVTGAGVTSGIDFGLTLVQKLRGTEYAQIAPTPLRVRPPAAARRGLPRRKRRKEVVTMTRDMLRDFNARIEQTREDDAIAETHGYAIRPRGIFNPSRSATPRITEGNSDETTKRSPSDSQCGLACLRRPRVRECTRPGGSSRTLPGRQARSESDGARGPGGGKIPVAIVIGKDAEVLDFTGPLEVFAQAYTQDGKPLFAPYMVAAALEPVTVGGGMKVVPDHTFKTAPPPKIIVIPAMALDAATPEMIEWIRKASKSTDVTMSVCNGAFVLAKTGLLSGKRATAHHGGYFRFAGMYPECSPEAWCAVCRGRKYRHGRRCFLRHRFGPPSRRAVRRPGNRGPGRRRHRVSRQGLAQSGLERSVRHNARVG